jgi:hypothetical protein
MRQSVVIGAPPLNGSPSRASGQSRPDGSVTICDVRRLTEAHQPVAAEPGGGARSAAGVPRPVWP